MLPDRIESKSKVTSPKFKLKWSPSDLTLSQETAPAALAAVPKQFAAAKRASRAKAKAALAVPKSLAAPRTPGTGIGRRSTIGEQKLDTKVKEWCDKLQCHKVLQGETTKQDLYHARRFLGNLEKSSGVDATFLEVDNLLKACNSAMMILPADLKNLSGDQVKAPLLALVTGGSSSLNIEC